MATKNLLVAQSGGPSPVINSSLRGVVETAQSFPNKIGKIYAGEIMKSAPAGTWFLSEAGQWTRK